MKTILVTGSSKGIGKYLTETYLEAGNKVIGCSRSEGLQHENYQHFKTDITQESDVKAMFSQIRKQYGGLDVLINNAGVASMNHSLLTPADVAQRILNTNVLASFICCREAAKLMRKKRIGRIVNFSTVAVPLNLEGEAIYASSKSAVESLTKILAREFSEFGVTVNAVGPTPIHTDLIKNIPTDKIDALVSKQAIKRMGTFADVKNVIDFFVQSESDFVTGQVVYLGGV